MSIERLWLPAMAIWVMLAMQAMQGPASAASTSPFTAIEGVWSGNGQVRFDTGSSERLLCKAYYNTKGGGSGLSIAIRCASPSYKIELRSNLTRSGNRVSGSWEERTYNTGGTVAGTATSGSIRLTFSGNVMGSLAVSFGGSQQRVTITAGNGGGGKPATIYLNLSRG